MAMTNFRAEDMRPKASAESTKPVGLVGITEPVEEPKNFKKGKKATPVETVEEPVVETVEEPVVEVEAEVEAEAEVVEEAPVEVDEA